MDDVNQDGWREALDQSWAKVSGEPAGPVAAEPVAPTPETAPATPEAPSDGPARDASGRFAKSEEKLAAASKGTPAPRATDAGAQAGADVGAPGGPPATSAAPTAPPAPVSDGLKAPQSWTPAEREAFGKAPPEVQRAALRREAEITRALNETAEPRKLREAVAPYEHLFRQAGLATPQAVGNVLRTYAQLQTAPPQIRAQIFGQLIRDHLGTDEGAINLLAAALEGKPVQPGVVPQTLGPEQIQSIVQQQLQAERQQTIRQQAQSVLQQFEATQPEHLDAVREDMGELLGTWERRNPGAPVTVDVFQQAYKKACLLNDEVSAIENQKREAHLATTANAATQKARASAVSVKSSPAGPAAPTAPGDDWRSHLEASWDRSAKQ